MHIAFSTVRDLLAAGGIEKYTLELGSRLASRGHRVTVFSTAHYSAEQQQRLGMNVITCRSIASKFGEKAIASATAALKMLFDGDYDICHQHSIVAGAFNRLANFGSARSSVLQMHGVEWRRTKWRPAARAAVHAIERFSIHQHRHWTAVSRTQCRQLRAEYGIEALYIPTAATIHPTADCQLIHGEWGLQPGGYVLFASRLVPEKGAHLLIDAFQRLRTDLRLVIAGDSANDRAYVDSLHRRAAGDPRIVFTGTVGGRRLQELFSNCYLYVQPSVVEGLSLALLEAMSFGACCLVSDIDENREAIAETGETFESDNADDLRRKLSGLLANRGMVHELGQAARERVRQHYDWEHVTGQIEELYHSMLAADASALAGRRAKVETAVQPWVRS